MNRFPRPTSPALCMTWAWAGLLFSGMVAQFSYHPWEFVDAPYELYLAKSLDLKAMVIHGFTEDVVYRPLNRVGIDLLYGVVGANLIVFKALTVILFAGVLWCFVALFRVATRYQALAAGLALSCFVGLHTSTVMFGAVLVFLMASSLVESGRYRRVGSVALVVALLFGWTWRSAESMLLVRDRAFESYSDWILRYDPERPRRVPDPTLLLVFQDVIRRVDRVTAT